MSGHHSPRYQAGEHYGGAAGGWRSAAGADGLWLARDVNAASGLTDSGAVLGTPWYMSPEQTRGEIRTMDRRTGYLTAWARRCTSLSGAAAVSSQTTVDALVDIMSREARR